MKDFSAEAEAWMDEAEPGAICEKCVRTYVLLAAAAAVLKLPYILLCSCPAAWLSFL